MKSKRCKVQCLGVIKAIKYVFNLPLIINGDKTEGKKGNFKLSITLHYISILLLTLLHIQVSYCPVLNSGFCCCCVVIFLKAMTLDFLAFYQTYVCEEPIDSIKSALCRQTIDISVGLSCFGSFISKCNVN